MAASEPDYLPRSALADLQREGLRDMLERVLALNPFYTRKLAANGLRLRDLLGPNGLSRLPFTTKAELVADQEAAPPYGTVLTFPLERYCRLHQTSGTSTGRPLRWLDTPDSWHWMLDCWNYIFRFVGLQPTDRLFFPFSFGPFLGFWSAFEAGTRRGNLCLPGGGMSSGARVRFLLDNRATIVLSTPTYALWLAEVAHEEKLDLAASPVRALILAGEPGACIGPTRARLEESWGARVFDHSGMTEIGPVAIECQQNAGGLHLLETEYLAEVIDPATGQSVAPGTVGELVLTNLGRWGSPLLRYRTGDLVRVDPRPCPCGRSLLRLDGGILGRVDDMIYLRGNNIYPAALEALLRRCAGVAEYRVEIEETTALPVLRIEVEPAPGAEAAAVVQQIDKAIRDELLFRAEVRAAAPGSLPRFEMKARRISRRGLARTEEQTE